LSSPQKTLRPILRFADLKRRGIATNWSTLKRLIDRSGFPKGFLLTEHMRCWFEADVATWLESRPGYDQPKLIGGAKMRVAGETLKSRKAKGGGR
jgi:hypothetical protein